VCCSVLLRVAVCCSVSRVSRMPMSQVTTHRVIVVLQCVLHCIAVCCSVFELDAVRCSVLLCVACVQNAKSRETMDVVWGGYGH